MGTDACNQRDINQAERIKRETEPALSHEELMRAIQEAQQKSLKIAARFYRNKNIGKAASLLRWLRDPQSAISATKDARSTYLGEDPALTRYAGLIPMLFNVLGGKTNALRSDESDALEKLGKIARSATGIPSMGASVASAFSGYSIGYFLPAIRAIVRQLDVIAEQGRTENDDYLEDGDPVNLTRWDLEPCGRPMFDFMVALKNNGDNDTGTERPTASVLKCFLDGRSDFDKIFKELHGSSYKDLPVTGWFFSRKIDIDKFDPWVNRHKDEIWILLYGKRKVPTEWPPL